MEGPKIRRLYYSSSDVCKIAQVRPHVLRAWETKFTHLKPSKSRSGRRLFKPRDLETVLKIKEFMDEGYTEDKILYFLEHKDEEELIKKEVSTDREYVQKSELISEIYTELEEILNMLIKDQEG